MAATLAEGRPVLIFPEGTRSPHNQLGPLHKGAFAVALRQDVPVVPVAVSCSPPVLTKQRPWHDFPRHAARYVVEPLEALPPPHGSSRRLMRRVRERLVAALASDAHYGARPHDGTGGSP